jgi:hypothetical protein
MLLKASLGNDDNLLAASDHLNFSIKNNLHLLTGDSIHEAAIDDSIGINRIS